MRRSSLVSLTLLFALTGCGVVPSGGTPLASPTHSITITPAVFPSQTPKPDSVPSQTPHSTPSDSPESCSEAHGSVQPYQIQSGEDILTGRIYTPPCYGESPAERYPVLYLFHGATDTDQQWIDLGVNEIADRLILAGDIPPLLIVLPRELTWLSLPDDPFGDQLIQDVIPWVERNYLVVPSRSYRAVGGLSRGGNWAVRLGLLDWGLFGSLGCHSTPLFYGDLNKISSWLKAIPTEKVPRIYIDIGQGDHNLEQAQAFRELLEENGIEPEWHLNPGLHDEDYWSSHVEEYLRWYSLGWPDQNEAHLEKDK